MKTLEKNRKFLIFLISFLFLACSKNMEVDRAFSRAENYMELNPDSALYVLEEMSPDLLSSEATKARYAMLMSQALDKNYIDTTDFKVLQPAIDYYINDDKGSTNDKMRTLYYQSRIYYNGGDRDNAMKALVSCLDLKDKATDSMTIARALVFQGSIQYSIYEYDDYIRSMLEAFSLYDGKGFDALASDCLTRAFDGAIQLQDRARSDSLLNLCVNRINENKLSKEVLYTYLLNYAKEFSSKEELEEIAAQNTTMEYMSVDGLMNLADSYILLSKPQSSKEILMDLKEMAEENNITYNKTKFAGILATSLDSMKDYRNAMNEYKNFMDLLMIKLNSTWEQRIESSEQRHMLELKAQKELKAKDNLIWGCVAGIMALSFGIAVMSLVVRSGRIKKNLAIQQEKTTKLENENLRHRIAVLESERDELNSLIASQPELPAEVREAVQVRIKMLNSLLASQISSNEKYGKDYEAWVSEQIADTESFMNSTRLAFKASHPDFISHFEKHGLTTDEINYVCLYAIGLKGIEVGAYMKKRSHVNVSSAIRRKLGLDKHETNIGIYVRRLLK